MNGVCLSRPLMALASVCVAINWARAWAVSSVQGWGFPPGPQRGFSQSLLCLDTTWSGLTVKDLGRRLHRDPSMITRLYAGYVVKRTGSLEKAGAGDSEEISQYSCLTPIS